MESIFFKEVLNYLDNMPSVNTILLISILLGVTYTFRYFKRQITRIYNEIKYSQDYIQAMDTALEHSFKNGYADMRDEKLKQLNEKESRVAR